MKALTRREMENFLIDSSGYDDLDEYTTEELAHLLKTEQSEWPEFKNLYEAAIAYNR